MEDDGSSQEGGPEIPSGVLRTSKKGWAGEEMEMEHQNQQQDSSKDNYAAVNIKQFQNTVVGEGYQARGVVRQKTAGEIQSDIRDITATRKADSSMEGARPKETKSTGTATERRELDEYLRCDGIREFRKEIEQLLASDSTSMERTHRAL